ncbi:hypothetical protein LSH36_158g05001 [Paralvinella palmiformis]|uniref:Serine-threonine/tyrosine-protein kinase catalytic domain-containing protein n=1 Tax=Paralvinella palmiformis TaxID=53620 RepID=A0AAD9JU65_9ANNE|nr:hypothetical protein LSH36_158g05001 [Paralvinella palmiformis]
MRRNSNLVFVLIRSVDVLINSTTKDIADPGSKQVVMTSLYAEIIDRVRHPPNGGIFRPPLSKIQAQQYVLNTIQDCWHEIPEARPDFRTIRSRLKPMQQGLWPTILGNKPLQYLGQAWQDLISSKEYHPSAVHNTPYFITSGTI